MLYDSVAGKSWLWEISNYYEIALHAYAVNPASSISGASFLSSTEQMKKGASESIDIFSCVNILK